MKLIITLSTIGLLLALGGCATSPQQSDSRLIEFHQSMSKVTNKYRDDKDMLRSAIQAIKTNGSKTADIEKAASLAALSLQYQPAHFKKDAGSLAKLVEHQPLYQRGPSIQGLAYLGGELNGYSQSQLGKLASSKVRHWIDKACADPADAILNTSDDSVQPNLAAEQQFNAALAQACWAWISNSKDAVYHYLIDAAVATQTDPSLGQVLMAAKITKKAQSAARVFVYRMGKHNITFGVPLSIND